MLKALFAMVVVSSSGHAYEVDTFTTMAECRAAIVSDVSLRLHDAGLNVNQIELIECTQVFPRKDK